MARCFIEIRKSAARGTESIAADIMRHLHARQHLGKAMIIGEQPLAMLSATRKQWLKLSRIIQRQRASTLNADKILKYTHTITHMQHMHFTSKIPLENPAADVYFLQPDQVHAAPAQCWTIYLLHPLHKDLARDLLRVLPAEALIVDYSHALPWEKLGLQPKRVLEQRVEQEWRQAGRFLRSHNIHIADLKPERLQSAEAMDDALDILLGTSHQFLQVANEFRHSLELARPMRISKELRAEYDTLTLLAHRVQALTLGAFNQQFLQTYDEDDTFFLYDAQRGGRLNEQILATMYARHLAAGRRRLAEALRIATENYFTLEKHRTPV